MSTTKPPLLQRLLKAGAIAAIAVAVLVWPLAMYLESTAVTVHLIHPFDKDLIEANRFTFEEDSDGSPPTDEDVIAIYGSVSGSKPEAIVLPDDAKIIRPKEKQDLALYAKGDSRAWQVKFVKYVTRVVSIGAAGAGFVLVLLLAFLRRRQASKTQSAPA